jgi:hypothetical protein
MMYSGGETSPVGLPRPFERMDYFFNVNVAHQDTFFDQATP